jgi:hypothetical protein
MTTGDTQDKRNRQELEKGGGCKEKGAHRERPEEDWSNKEEEKCMEI